MFKLVFSHSSKPRNPSVELVSSTYGVSLRGRENNNKLMIPVEWPKHWWKHNQQPCLPKKLTPKHWNERKSRCENCSRALKQCRGVISSVKGNCSAYHLCWNILSVTAVPSAKPWWPCFSRGVGMSSNPSRCFFCTACPKISLGKEDILCCLCLPVLPF